MKTFNMILWLCGWFIILLLNIIPDKNLMVVLKAFVFGMQIVGMINYISITVKENKESETK